MPGGVRVAVVSDIHGNLTALEAVVADLRRRAPGLVMHGGDLALMGPRPAEVVDRVRELGWPGVVGNTDELLWRPGEHQRQLERAPALAALLALLFDAYAPDTRERLGEERLAWLAALPAEHRTEQLTVVHAQPGDLWRAPTPDASDTELSSAYAPLEAAQVAYGHIHRPFARVIDGMTIANTGSVGMPWDGDPRASYLLIDDGVAEVVRVAYDIETEARMLHTAGHGRAVVTALAGSGLPAFRATSLLAVVGSLPCTRCDNDVRLASVAAFGRKEKRATSSFGLWRDAGDSPER